MNYWNKKNEMKDKALAHNNKMNEIYKLENTNSILKTKHENDFFMKNYEVHKRFNDTSQKVVLEDCVDCLLKICENNKNDNICILNFASFKEPGGAFLQGSTAQEEVICHNSNLYNVLCCFKSSFYDVNKQHLNRGLYSNEALYTSDIVFEKNNAKKFASVITCAAPNKKTAQKYCNVSEKVCYQVLKSRIDFVLSVANKHNVDILLFGAFGCGVFGNNPKEVAKICNELVNGKYKNCFKEIIHPIIDKKTFNVFKEEIK